MKNLDITKRIEALAMAVVTLVGLSGCSKELKEKTSILEGTMLEKALVAYV